ncbi:TerB N-terminal domain-containing protein [Kribbella sp. NBC_00382]
MGLFDAFRRPKQPRIAGRHTRAAPQTETPGRSGLPAPARHQSPPRATQEFRRPAPAQGWIPPGTPVSIAGLTIPDGMLYVGRQLHAGNGHGIDPALIDPALRVDFTSPDWSGATVGYWPSYSEISPQARAAYLTWLAGGRREPNVPVSWPFLFFYGLERRLLVDWPQGQAAVGDLQQIRVEVGRLLALYGGSHSFRSYASNLLSTIDFYTLGDSSGGQGLTLPARTAERWPVPLALQITLGGFAVNGSPVPSDWARAWAHFHPEIYPRTPATRCPDEFDALFHERYQAKYKAGLTIRPAKRVLKHEYHPASAGIDHAVLTTHLPDVLTQAAPTQKLAALVEDCTTSLDAYSRYLGRNPDGRGSLAATALLPRELMAKAGGELARLTAFVDARLGEDSAVLIEASDLLAFWPAKSSDKLLKAEAVALAQLLAESGVGLEPDVRFGGPVLSPGAAVLFRTSANQPSTPTSGYAAAAILLHLAASVSMADGDVSDAETQHLKNHLHTSMHLSLPESLRLQAHLMWLLAGQTKLSGLTKRLATLGEAERSAVGDFLATVAAADGVVSPAEVTTLTKIFKLLGLDPASAYSRIHAATVAAGFAPATSPVTVRPAAPSPGFAVPSPPVRGPGTAGGAIQLDEARVAAKLAETVAVAALLNSIFVDDEIAPAPVVVRPDTPALAGLDTPHSSLLRVVATHSSWPRADFEAACEGLELLPDGALDTLNEAAYDLTGAPVADGDDPIEIDSDVLQEMLA